MISGICTGAVSKLDLRSGTRYHSPMTWSVLLLEEKLPLPAETLSHLLQKAIGGVALDFHHTIRTQYGWIARGLTQEVAEHLILLLKEAGLPARAKRDDEMVYLERRFLMTNGALREDAFNFQETLAGDERAVPWESLAVVSIGSVPLARQKAVRARVETRKVNKAVLMTTGIPIKQKKKGMATTFETVKDEGILLHLVVMEEPALLLETRPSRFDYHYLGERARETPAENFRLLLTDLARWGKKAHWTEMARRFAKEGTLEPGFSDERDFLRFTRWITEKTMT